MTVINVLNKKTEVMNDTWGHLKPKRTCYTGFVTLFYGEYRDSGIFSTEINIPDSPWWFEHLGAIVVKYSTQMEEGSLLRIKIKVYPRRDRETFRIKFLETQTLKVG